MKGRSNQGPSAVIFDMDGLLINSEPLWQQAEISAFQSVGFKLTPAMCPQTKGMRLDEMVAYWFRIGRITAATAGDVASSVLSRLAELVLTQAEPLPGAIDAVRTFREMGAKIGIASSSPLAIITAVMRRFDLDPYVQAARSAESEDYGKPHPAVFLSTARALDVAAPDCLAFEDSINGVISAKAARMKVVAVPDASEVSDPKFTIADLRLATLQEVDYGEIIKLFAQQASAGKPRRRPATQAVVAEQPW